MLRYIHGPRAELAAAAPPLAGALASRHPHGRRSCDGRALLVVLVFESPLSMIFKRLKLFFAHLELHSSRNLYQTVVCGLCRKPVNTPKNRRAAVRRAPHTSAIVQDASPALSTVSRALIHQAAHDCRSRRARSGCFAPAGANAGQHTVGVHLSDGHVLPDVLVLERPSR